MLRPIAGKTLASLGHSFEGHLPSEWRALILFVMNEYMLKHKMTLMPRRKCASMQSLR
jgi:hypothetical protein